MQTHGVHTATRTGIGECPSLHEIPMKERKELTITFNFIISKYLYIFVLILLFQSFETCVGLELFFSKFVQTYLLLGAYFF